MVLDIKLINTSLKPVFLIRTPDKKNLHLRSLQALLDTGSTKVIWCSTKNDIADTDFEKTGETTTLSGFGIGEQTGCKIYKGSFSIYSTGKGVTFKDIEVVESTKKIAAFDILLPYALFHEFEYTFKPASSDAKFGRLMIDTLNSRVIHRVKSYGGVVTEVYSDGEEGDEGDSGKAMR